MLFITPRVVESEVDIRGAIDDLRRKMENLDRLFPYIPPFTSIVFPERPPAPAPASGDKIPVPADSVTARRKLANVTRFARARDGVGAVSAAVDARGGFQ